MLELALNREVRLIINTPTGSRERTDDRQIRSTAVSHRISCTTNLAAVAATIQGMEALLKPPLTVQPLHDYHAQLIGTSARG